MKANYFTILYWFCHTSTWIHPVHTHVPHPEPPSHPPPRTIPPGHPSAPAPRILYQTWTGNSFLIWYYTCFHAINRLLYIPIQVKLKKNLFWNNFTFTEELPFYEEFLYVLDSASWRVNMWPSCVEYVCPPEFIHLSPNP